MNAYLAVVVTDTMVIVVICGVVELCVCCFFSWQVKRSMLAADTISKNSSGASGSAKGHLAKGPANTISSPPNPKIREAA